MALNGYPDLPHDSETPYIIRKIDNLVSYEAAYHFKKICDLFVLGLFGVIQDDMRASLWR